jgi:CPA2 family monovalent cation:H+ antiporter-2
LGEFSFLLVAQGVSEGLVDRLQYGRMLFIALGTLLATPWLLKIGLRWTEDERPTDEHGGVATLDSGLPKVALFGVGLIGRQLSSRLESSGADVCLVDLSPVNLYPFAQQGFRTIAGDARDPAVLDRADIVECQLVIVAVPDDLVAIDIVRAVRQKAPRVPVLVRCRYELNRPVVLQAGATRVVTEEAEAAGRLLQHCESLLAPPA